MLVKELRQALRARGFVGLFVVAQLVAIAVFWWTIELNFTSGLRSTFDWLDGIFWGMLNVVLLLVVPLRGLGSLRAEIDNKTLDLLVLTHLSSWRIVLDKWFALVAQALLFLMAILPYGVVRYFFGSVDLMHDLLMIGWLFLVGITLAAVCLWVSGLAKIFRILLPVVLFFAVQSFGLAAVFSAAMPRRSGASLGNPGFAGGALLVIATVTFLALAVRRIAPPAENSARLARLAALGLLLVAAVVAASGFPEPGQVLGFGLGFVAVTCAVELSRDCLPMRSHRPTWRWLRGWPGRLLLPGWPSAALFAAAVLAALAVAAFTLSLWRSGGVSRFALAWWLVLAWQALVFPAVLLSFLPASSSLRVGGAGYFVIQGLFGVVSLLSVNNSADLLTGEYLARALDTICQVLPVFSCWLGVERIDTGFPAWAAAGQTVSLLVLVALTRRQSRSYWGAVARLDQPASAPATRTS